MAEIRGLTLWRSFITGARRQGVDQATIMRMSGHKTESVFRRYNIVDEDDVREAQKRLEKGRKT